jgi:hypothetical protein
MIFPKDPSNDGNCPKCKNNVGSLSHILNSCGTNLTAMTERHNDVVKILAQALKRCKDEMLPIQKAVNGEISDTYVGRYGWNSCIQMPSINLEDIIPKRDLNKEELEADVRLRPDLWFWRVETTNQDNIERRCLTLNLIEVTVPWGSGKYEWKKDEDNQELLYELGNVENDTLSIARQRKEQKYAVIEEHGRKLIEKNMGFLKDNLKFAFDDTAVVTHYVIISSLGIVPKETYKTVRQLFKVRDRNSSQAAYLIIKRMVVAVLKRSHEIYTNTYNRDSYINEVHNLNIQRSDDNEEIRDMIFDTFQTEISSGENFIVGNPFDPRVAADENVPDCTKRRRRECQIICEKENSKKLLEPESDIESEKDMDCEHEEEAVIIQQTNLYNNLIQIEMERVTSTSHDYIQHAAAQSTSFPESSHKHLNSDALPRIGMQNIPLTFNGDVLHYLNGQDIKANSEGGEIVQAPVETLGGLCSSIDGAT